MRRILTLFIVGLLASTPALANPPFDSLPLPMPPDDWKVYVEPVLIPANANGQFYITVRIDGIPITALVDTGASTLVLSSEYAEKVGIDVKNLRFTTTTNTANGTAPRATPLLHEVNIGGIILRDVKATCCALGGKSLLGMTALS